MEQLWCEDVSCDDPRPRAAAAMAAAQAAAEAAEAGGGDAGADAGVELDEFGRDVNVMRRQEAAARRARRRRRADAELAAFNARQVRGCILLR